MGNRLPPNGSPLRRGGRSGEAKEKDYGAAAESLLALMDKYGVTKSIIVVVPTHSGQSGESDYGDIRNAVRKFPGRLYLMGGGATLNPILQNTDPFSVPQTVRKQFEEKAEKIIRDGAIGFGEMLALHLCMSKRHSYQVAIPNHPLFLLLSDIAARHDVPIDLHMEAVPREMPAPSNLTEACSANPSILPATIPAFEQLLAHNRKAKIVWQHIGWDNTGYMTTDLLRRLLDDHSNLFLSMRVEERQVVVGGDEAMPNRIVNKNWKIRPEWIKLIGDYPDRFMIGGDEFVGVPGKTRRWPQSFEETWSTIDQLPPDLAKKVGHDNASRIYKID